MKAQLIAYRLKNIIDNKRLSQKEFAESLEVHVKSVQNYVGGKTVPDGEILERVCRNFGVSANWLLLGEGGMFRDEESIGPSDPREREYLLRAYEGLRPKRRKILRGFLTILRKIQRRDRLQEWVRKVFDGDEYQDLWVVRERFEKKEWKIIKAFADFKSAHTFSKYRLKGGKAGAAVGDAADKELRVSTADLKKALAEYTNNWEEFLQRGSRQ